MPVHHRAADVALGVVLGDDAGPGDGSAHQCLLDEVGGLLAVAGQDVAEPQQRTHPGAREGIERLTLPLVHAAPARWSRPVGGDRRSMT